MFEIVIPHFNYRVFHFNYLFHNQLEIDICNEWSLYGISQFNNDAKRLAKHHTLRTIISLLEGKEKILFYICKDLKYTSSRKQFPLFPEWYTNYLLTTFKQHNISCLINGKFKSVDTLKGEILIENGFYQEVINTIQSKKPVKIQKLKDDCRRNGLLYVQKFLEQPKNNHLISSTMS